MAPSFDPDAVGFVSLPGVVFAFAKCEHALVLRDELLRERLRAC